MHAFLPHVEMKCCNLLFDIDVLYPYLSWMTTFYSVFLVQYINHFLTKFLHFLCTDLYFIFFCSPIPYFFLLHCCFPSPFHPFPCVFTFPFLVFSKCPFPSLSYPLFSLSLSSFPVSIPYVHASVLEQMFLGPTCPN